MAIQTCIERIPIQKKNKKKRKKQSVPSIYSFHSRDAVNFRVLWPDWPHSFLTIPSLKIFFSPINLCKFVLKCKKSGYFIDLFWRYNWLKNPKVLPISQEHKFSQIWDLRWYTGANNKNFPYRTNSVQINDEIFLAHFWSIFQFFGQK